MSGKFENKVVVVSGGTSGIGLVTARHFAVEGASVFAMTRSGRSIRRSMSCSRMPAAARCCRSAPSPKSSTRTRLAAT